MKTMEMRKILFAGLFFVLGLTIALAQVKLTFNPEKGAKYEYLTETTQNIKQQVASQDMTTETKMNFSYLMEIKDKTPQETQVQFIYRDVLCKISSPMMNMGYDSKKPNESTSEMDKMLGKIFGALIDKPFIVVVAPNGTAKSVTGMDAVAEAMTKAIAGDGQMASQIGEQMKQQFTGDYMKNSFEQMFKIYPSNAVKTGDSWNIENTNTVSGMKTDIKTKYTLKEVNRNMATVPVDATIEMNPGSGMEGKLAGTQTGTINIDTGTGLPVAGDMSQNVKGAVKTQGMEIQMELNSKVKMSIKEIK
jgi:hypothetical protein